MTENFMPGSYTLSSYGSVPDMRQTASGAAITAGSTTLTISGAGFTSADIGKTVVVGTGGIARHIVTISAIISDTQVTMSAAALITLGATGASWGTDCTAALQAAFDQLALSGGGQLLIDGHYLLAGAVSKNFLIAADQIEIVGTGSNSAFAVSAAQTGTPITIQSMARLIIRDVHFIGTPNQPHDFSRLLYLDQCNVTFQDCGFWGLGAISSPGDAIIFHDDCDFEMVNCHFGGCATNSAQGTSVVDGTVWRGLHFNRCRWIDYGQFNGILHSKTAAAISLSWVRVRDTAGPVVHAIAQRVARIVDCRGDENAVHGVCALPDPGKQIGRLFIDGWESNVGPFGDGIYANTVINAEILRCSFGYVTPMRDAILIDSCTNVLIDRCETSNGATQLTATNIGELIISRCPTITTRNLTGIGRYSQGQKATMHLPNIAGSLIATNAYFTYAVTGVDCTSAAVLVSASGNGEGGAADRYRVGHEVLNRTNNGCDVRIYNFGAGQTVDVDIEVSN